MLAFLKQDVEHQSWNLLKNRIKKSIFCFLSEKDSVHLYTVPIK